MRLFCALVMLVGGLAAQSVLKVGSFRNPFTFDPHLTSDQGHFLYFAQLYETPLECGVDACNNPCGPGYTGSDVCTDNACGPPPGRSDLIGTYVTRAVLYSRQDGANEETKSVAYSIVTITDPGVDADLALSDQNCFFYGGPATGSMSRSFSMRTALTASASDHFACGIRSRSSCTS